MKLQAARHPAAPFGRARRLGLAGLSLALVLSLAMADDPAHPPPPSREPRAAVTYTLFLPLAFNNYTNFRGPEVPFGYGWNVFQYQSFQPYSDYPQYPATSFNWLKVNDNPPWQTLCGAGRLPYNVLLRLNKADANATAQEVADDTWQWAHWMEGAPGEGKCVEAFEIGNEPNLSGSGQYNGPVDPVQYADQLCEAYKAIKTTDPSFIVVSAGLAPTGGADDPRLAMAPVPFLNLMLDAIQANPLSGGEADGCFDVLGYHNYGFRTGFETDPADADLCPAGMCYRGAEEIWAVLQAHGVVKRIWSTETGWMRDYAAAGCASAGWAPVFAGFALPDEAQAANLVGAYEYARAHWPWIGAMFVFNLDFNPPRRSSDPCYDEQGWFAVQGYAAEAALEAMPKKP